MPLLTAQLGSWVVPGLQHHQCTSVGTTTAADMQMLCLLPKQHLPHVVVCYALLSAYRLRSEA
jgi:hypothetical protein